MKFSPTKVAFSRHESFALRYSWLTKGFLAFKKDPKIFQSDYNVVTLGVGRNMVNAIRYWLQAAQMIRNSQNKGYQSTEIGEFVFGDQGMDLYLEDEATIWLIHWLICTNPELATSCYWLFNCFHKPEFTAGEATSALLDFVDRNISSKLSASSIKKDISLILRTYAGRSSNSKPPLEEDLDSPLSLLNLISHPQGSKTFVSRPMEREGLPLEIFGFAIAQLFEHLQTGEISIEDLMYSQNLKVAPGAIFRLTENALVTKLEKLVLSHSSTFELRETAGIRQLYLLQPATPLRFLQKYYSPLLNEAS